MITVSTGGALRRVTDRERQRDDEFVTLWTRHINHLDHLAGQLEHLAGVAAEAGLRHQSVEDLALVLRAAHLAASSDLGRLEMMARKSMGGAKSYVDKHGHLLFAERPEAARLLRDGFTWKLSSPECQQRLDAGRWDEVARELVGPTVWNLKSYPELYAIRQDLPPDFDSDDRTDRSRRALSTRLERAWPTLPRAGRSQEPTGPAVQTHTEFLAQVLVQACLETLGYPKPKAKSLYDAERKAPLEPDPEVPHASGDAHFSPAASEASAQHARGSAPSARGGDD